MNSQSGIKIFFRKIETLVVLGILLFACTTSPETLQNPAVKPTKTKSSPAPSTPDIPDTPNVTESNKPPVKTFSIQNANKVTPSDVLEEISFGGQGGGGTCEGGGFSSPSIEKFTKTDREWLEHFDITTCGWWSDDEVRVTVELPNGTFTTDIIEVHKPTSGVPNAYYEYWPDIDSPLGTYKYSFNGNSGNVEHSVNVTIPSEPRIYYIDNIQSYYLYGFYSNENIRLLLYNVYNNRVTFKAWENYTVDANGNLIIKADYREGIYFVVGDLSGPANRASLIVNKSLSTNSQSSLESCRGALPSRLEAGKYAYVATDPPLDNRIREGAGTNYSIIGYVGTGNAMKILDGPKCADGWVWWKVQSIKKPDLVGWTSEGDDVYWLIPCETLDSCP